MATSPAALSRSAALPVPRWPVWMAVAATGLAVALVALVELTAPPTRLDQARVTSDRSPTFRLVVGRAVGGGWSAAIDARSVAVVRSGRELVVSAPRLADGKHTLEVSGGWAGPLRASDRWTFVIDSKAPKPVFKSELPASTATKELRLPIAAIADAAIDVKVNGRRVDGRPTRAAAQWTVPVTLLDGDNRVEVLATDAAGNRGGVVHRVLVDTIAPKLAVDAPRGPATKSPAIGVRATDGGGAVRVRATVSGVAMRATRRAGSWVVAPSQPLLEGEHRWAIIAVDRAGNEAFDAGTFLVDSTESLADTGGVRRGARGADVAALVSELRRQGHAAAPGSDLYGPEVEAAVRAFQQAEGLPIDGVAGPRTLAALTLRIEIDQSDHMLRLFQYGRVERSYRVAVGAKKYPTPNGEFSITDMQKNPIWMPPDSEWAKDEKPIPPGPDNPLGTRWMGIGDAIGIHGTNSPASLGYSVSHGCIRMAIPEVEQLFELVQPGTKVIIRP